MSRARTAVVGDIHGCVDELDRLLDTIDPGDRDTLVFLGDYIDRGPSAKAVIDRLLRLSREGPRCVFLKGNHEDMFLDFLGCGGRCGEVFLVNGGDATLNSYGIIGLSGAEVRTRIPPEHLGFFVGLARWFIAGEFLCVHAGVNPRRPLDGQSDEDLLWIRDRFVYQPHPFPYTVLFGHTPHREVFVDLPYKIGLDTGLVYGNFLTAYELSAKDLFQIRRGESDVRRRPLLRRSSPRVQHA